MSACSKSGLTSWKDDYGGRTRTRFLRCFYYTLDLVLSTVVGGPVIELNFLEGEKGKGREGKGEDGKGCFIFVGRIRLYIFNFEICDGSFLQFLILIEGGW